MEVNSEMYVKTPEDFETAKGIAMKLTETAYHEANGHFLIMLQALDIVQDTIQAQAIAMKNQLAAEKGESHGEN